MNVVVMHQGRAASFLRADLAGSPFASHLPVQFLSMAQEDVFVIDRENPFPGQPASLTAEFVTGHALLVVAGDAWFSKAALRMLVALIADKPDNRSLVHTGGQDAGDGKLQKPLAAYLPAADTVALLREYGLAFFSGSFAVLCHRLGNCEVIAAQFLDPVIPPVQIDNLLDLAILERRILYERACAALLRGIRIRDPNRVFIRGDLHCGSGVEIEIDVIIEGKVTLGEGAKVGANSILINSTIGANTRVNPFSIIEDAVIGSNTFVGPYGRIRPGSRIGDFAQIGNFVEIKNSVVGSGSRINHLAFVGDATLETNVTIGAGSITCNHDGVGVSRTEIKAGVYVGSGCELVAPLSIGENATIGAGSTITEDVPAGKLVLARSRQMAVDNWVRPNKKLAEK